MQGSDVLTVIAEIGVALAGFSGIVVALRQRSVESWSVPEVLRLRLMLYASVSALLFALLPFAPHHLGASPAVTWSASSLVLAALFGFVWILPSTRTCPSRTGLSFRWYIFYSSGTVMATTALLANAGGLLGGPSFGLYLVGLAWLLLYATTLFVRLVLAPFATRGALFKGE